MVSERPGRGGFVGYFEWFVRSEVTGSVLLLACTVTALVVANSPWSAAYDDLLHTYIGVGWGDNVFKLSLHHWINDGLMVVFFFVVGLEVKRELVVGELSSFDKAALPVAAAVGGMVVPALLFVVFNAGEPSAAGWGIPMATDIAFALGVLAIFGRRVPIGLKVFLTALAIADDLGAVAVIALFYTEQINGGALAVAAIFLAILFPVVRLRKKRRGVVLAVMVVVWLAVFASGVHATIAGILLAMVIPVRPKLNVGDFVTEAEAYLEKAKHRWQSGSCIITDSEQLHTVEVVHGRAGDTLPAGLMLEHTLHPVQVWLILPLFALANAGVALGGNVLEVLTTPLALGIIVGLVIGKPVGIGLLSWLVVRSGKGMLPAGVNRGQVVGAGCLAGIGFTMSLFISELAFSDPTLINAAKIGILFASLTSAVLGFVILSRALPKTDG
ncbi:MAG: Na+/H+ antiporter NhaA [Thermoanaerobaculales bacterium]|jgi:NhaA family Na+:H+ antiporter|nr:Na+/H+ antiporter NhaA [Thermoanaerobaculales bacterium]